MDEDMRDAAYEAAHQQQLEQQEIEEITANQQTTEAIEHNNFPCT